jgi:hypothetical protein
LITTLTAWISIPLVKRSAKEKYRRLKKGDQMTHPA